jgi:hypothetical protein
MADMSPDERASYALRSYWHISNNLGLGECVAKAIKQAEQDAYTRVLSIVEEHKQSEAFVSLDELEDQIKQTMTDPI